MCECVVVSMYVCVRVHGCGSVDILNMWVCDCVGLLIVDVWVSVEVYRYVGVPVCKNVEM